MDTINCLDQVITSGEAARIWRLSRNAITIACRRGALPSRQSGQTWLVTLYDMLVYKRGKYWPDMIPDELKPAFEDALERYRENERRN